MGKKYSSSTCTTGDSETTVTFTDHNQYKHFKMLCDLAVDESSKPEEAMKADDEKMKIIFRNYEWTYLFKALFI